MYIRVFNVPASKAISRNINFSRESAKVAIRKNITIQTFETQRACVIRFPIFKFELTASAVIRDTGFADVVRFHMISQ